MMSKKELWKLRQEIVLNSIYTSDYENSYGIAPDELYEFFNGYFDELHYILLDEKGGDFIKSLNDNQYYKEIFALDNEDNLYNYYYSIENISF